MIDASNQIFKHQKYLYHHGLSKINHHYDNQISIPSLYDIYSVEENVVQHNKYCTPIFWVICDMIYWVYVLLQPTYTPRQPIISSSSFLCLDKLYFSFWCFASYAIYLPRTIFIDGVDVAL